MVKLNSSLLYSLVFMLMDLFGRWWVRGVLLVLVMWKKWMGALFWRLVVCNGEVRVVSVCISLLTRLLVWCSVLCLVCCVLVLGMVMVSCTSFLFMVVNWDYRVFSRLMLVLGSVFDLVMVMSVLLSASSALRKLILLIVVMV